MSCKLSENGNIGEDKMMDAARHYVEIKIYLTKCRQRHFKQLCNKCKEYATCELYAEYCQAWQDLQQEVK